MTALFWITVAVGGIWVVVFIKGLVELSKAPVIQRQAGEKPTGLPTVSVIIPARNEESNIEPCVRSLLDQTHPPLEVLVVDDSSQDATADRVRLLAQADSRVRLISAGPLPNGWMGKCHALWEGVQQGKPKGEWLLMVDADTRHQKECLAAALDRALKERAQLFSIFGHLEAKSFWERLVQPAIGALIGLFNNPRVINDPKKPDVFANGQFLLVQQAAYRHVGGHAAVAGRVLEDVELARVMVDQGFSNYIAVGRDLFSTRMYNSLGELINGWSKNFYLILRSSPVRVWAVVSLVVLLSFWPVVGLGLALGGWMAKIGFWTPAQQLVVVAVYGLVLTFQTVLRGLNRWYPAYAPFAWLGNLVVLAILRRSIRLCRAKQGISWKGRMVVDRQEDVDDTA